SMGAMLAISAQLYAQVTHIYHLWVASALEASGDIRDLKALERVNPTLYDEVLAPPRHQRQLVSLPTYTLGQRELVQTRERIEQRTTREIPRDPELSQQLGAVQDILRVLPRRMTVENTARFVGVLEALRRGDPLDDRALLDIFQHEGITDADAFVSTLKLYAQ